ncbi:MAG: hypothetical protein A3I01_03105 [Betaproteobacteria bacterium RIFCSPLOWO2_02_FULL_65_24]|nr:MAG: hypothetical protein A3I01_03105 [Betaproteobacteria bacterium RIFCSPLOWO2_02_FULL_65_24]OGA73009.1 MAG: hypothetical protein A3G27_04085 [Betaproteobacteria bacterium RIFCSPLOWO2_12_FULL_66_14]
MRMAFLVLLGLSLPAFGQDGRTRSAGQVLYLPIYSHVWYGEVDARGQPQKSLVSVLVSVRNVDARRALRLTSARYYDTEGKSLKEYVQTARVIGPMATYELFIPRSDDTGGSGANFVISWKSDVAINPPIVEALHVNLAAARSIAFTTTAREINAD